MASTNLVAPTAPPELLVAAVRDDRTLSDYYDVVAAAYGFPVEIGRALLSPRFFEDVEAESYVGYVEGRPVATSSLVFGGCVAAVHNVASHPDNRKRGYGEAPTSTRSAAEHPFGCDLAALPSSQMGFPIYERMGFRVTSPYETFHRPGIWGIGV